MHRPHEDVLYDFLRHLNSKGFVIVPEGCADGCSGENKRPDADHLIETYDKENP